MQLIRYIISRTEISKSFILMYSIYNDSNVTHILNKFDYHFQSDFFLLLKNLNSILITTLNYVLNFLLLYSFKFQSYKLITLARMFKQL